MASQKVSMNVDKESWDQLKAFAQGRGMTMTDFVQRALGTERFLIEKSEQGADVLLVKGDDKTQLVFR